MIDFSRVIDDVTLNCDTEPKTVFRIRSLNFDDDLWIQTELRKLGEYPTAAVARLQKRWKADGEDAELNEQEKVDLEICSQFWTERERLRCIRGIIEIDRKPVSSEDVAQKIGELPTVLRSLVQSELAEKISMLGTPAPKSEEQSESPLGSGRIGITPGGAANNAD